MISRCWLDVFEEWMARVKKTFWEFFAGGGMARAGLGSEWACLFANDIDENKAAVYGANWGDAEFRLQDIATIESSQIHGVADLAWASFPCQDLSLAGNGAGLVGDRSGTFWSFVSLMGKLRADGRKPRVIALENVYGAITSRGGEDFLAILEAIRSLGYRVGALVIDAVHFVPQSRQRLFVVAVDRDMILPSAQVGLGPNPAWHTSSIVKAHSQLKGAAKDSWVWWSMPLPRKRQVTLDDICEEHPLGVKWNSQEETNRLLLMMSPVNRTKVLQAQQASRAKVGTVYRRTRNGQQRAEVRFDGIAGCLRTPSGGSSRQTILVVDGASIRSRLLSPREAARLMGLDETYRLPSRYNDAYHLAGDGVVVPVVDHLATNVISPILEANCAPMTLRDSRMRNTDASL